MYVRTITNNICILIRDLPSTTHDHTGSFRTIPSISFPHEAKRQKIPSEQISIDAHINIELFCKRQRMYSIPPDVLLHYCQKVYINLMLIKFIN